MKPGVLLLNVARGGILDEADVAQALRDGRIAGAAVDVFEAEPPTGSPLLDAPNTLLTPHLGASTAEAQVAVAEEVAEQIIDVLDGRPARYAVNAPLLTPETAQAIAPYLPLAETLGRFLGQFAHAAPRTLTLEIAGEPAAYDASPLVAAVLRGLLETSTTERVNLVNAATMAKARGIKVVERKTSTAGAFASLLTVTAETDGRTATVAGTVANGEPHIVRLDEHAMDLAPADSMLITRHRDRPGTMGRIGVLLGEADVNISRDDAGALGAACRRVHGPRPRRPGPRGGRRGDPCRRRGDRRLDDPPRRRAVTPADLADPVDPAPPLIPEGLDATLVLLRHGESEWIREGRFQGQAETPLSADGPAAGGPRGRSARGAPRIADAAGARRPAARDRPLPPRPHDRDARRRVRDRGRPTASVARPEPGILEIAQGAWEGETHDEIARRWGPELAAWRRRPQRVGGARRRVARRRPGPRPAGAGRDPRATRSRLPPGQPRPAAGGRLPRRRPERGPAVVHPRRP